MNSRHSPLVTRRLASCVGGEEDAVARTFAVEGEAAVVGADLDDALAAAMPAQAARPRSRRARGKLAISGLERILGERREDVGEEQFLVLLLVIDAELDQARAPRAKASASARSSASSTWAR